MEIVYDKDSLERYMTNAVQVSNDSPVLLDSFLDHAIEVDIDVVCDGKDIVVGGIMEHIEQAGNSFWRFGLFFTSSFSSR